MGSGIARNLLRAGHEVIAYNRSRAKAVALQPDGAKVADTPADAAGVAEVVMTMLADDAALEAVLYSGILHAMKPDAVHVSLSTISTAMARRLAQEHTQRAQHYISAPVFGRPDAAEAKRLLVVAAGSATIVERCKPLFDAIGRQTFVLGEEAWTANAVKLCGNS
jgi:3-hydroxyisobutyrate dehydrogenase-like beta-hydroxyacid dehydrogenase